MEKPALLQTVIIRLLRVIQNHSKNTTKTRAALFKLTIILLFLDTYHRRHLQTFLFPVL